MNTAASTTNPRQTTPQPPDLAAIKPEQQAAWGSGDHAVMGTTLQIVGESLCDAVGRPSYEREMPWHS